MRAIEEMGVTVNQPPKVPRPEPAPRVAVPAHLREPGVLARVRGPVIEPDGNRVTVTFVHEAPDARGVLLFANRLTDESDLAASLMEPVAERWWALSLSMEPDWRASYAFLVHRADGRPPWEDPAGHVRLRAVLDRGEPDPHVADRVLNRAGVPMSVVSLPDAPRQQWIAPAHTPRPESVSVAGRDVWVHRVGAGRDVPMVLVLDGETWWDHHGLAASLDSAHASGAVPAHVAVFVASGSVEDRWSDVGRADGLTDWLAGALVPWAREHLDVSSRADDTVVAGQSLGGLSALWTVARHGDRIGAAIAMSASLWRGDPGPALVGARARVHLEVGRQEWVLLPLHRELAALLAQAPGVGLDVVEFNGGHDYACWRGGLVDAIVRMLRSN